MKPTGRLPASRNIRRLALGVCLLGLAAGCSHMSNTDKGVLGGGLVGAGTGAAIGNALGNTGAGAVVGTGVGMLAGGLTGNAVDRAEHKADVAQAKADATCTPEGFARRALEHEAQVRRSHLAGLKADEAQLHAPAASARTPEGEGAAADVQRILATHRAVHADRTPTQRTA